LSALDILRNKDLTEYIRDLEYHSDGTYRKSCDLHNGSNPTAFAVFPSNRYYCFSCGASGDIITYTMERDSITFGQSMEKLCEDYGIDLARDETYVKQKSIAEKNETWCKQYEKSLDKCYAYLSEKRGLTDEIIKKYRFGWTEKSNAITIPMVDLYGRIVSFGYRFFDQEPKYKNGKNNELFTKGSYLYNAIYAQRLIKDKKRLWVVEGFFDACSGQQQGEPTVAYCGITFSKDHVLLIKELTQRIDGVQIILVPDNDNKANQWVARGRDLFTKWYPDANLKVAVID
jgi:DNA primase